MGRGVRGVSLAGGFAVFMWATGVLWGVGPSVSKLPAGSIEHARNGDVLIDLSVAAISEFGWEFSVRGSASDTSSPHHYSSKVLETSTLVREVADRASVARGRIDTQGAIIIAGNGSLETVGNLSLRRDAGETWQVHDTLRSGRASRVVFELGSIVVDAPKGIDGLRMTGELLITREFAEAMGSPQAAGRAAGRLVLSIGKLQAEAADTVQADVAPTQTESTIAGFIGPDVILGNIYQTAAYGSSGGIAAFSLGTVSCNIGDTWLSWQSGTNQHPVIGQNLFRLKDGRFEQVGQAWLKHGFFALSENLCFNDCNATDGTHLGVHCSDPYSASLNGQQFNLGPKYQVDPNTGDFAYPPASPPYSGNIARRLQVLETDLDPTLNGGALYFGEGQYVTPDDAAAGNQDNNASYRRVIVSGSIGNWTLSLTSTTQREQPAIRAWKDTDPSVVETDIRVPDEGLMIVGAKVTDLGDGFWHYEYAVQNLNSYRSARAFSVPIDPTSKIRNVGFHDVPYHSSEPWMGTNWQAIVSNGFITWTTNDYTTNPAANALRWGTLYNFRFDANRPPQTSDVILTLFVTGPTNSVSGVSVGPVTNTNDCNGNTIPDSQDIVNGTSQDCDGNLIPDECQTEDLSAVRVASGLDSPVYVTAPKDDLSRLFIVERGGRIRILTGGAVLPTPFLDITGQVVTNGEQGLLSMAFHPQYAANGRFYVYYTNLSGDSNIAQFTVSGDPNQANAASQIILKTIGQTGTYHQGGQLQFAADGKLLVGMGDSGGAYDPLGHAQNTGSPLGKMLRFDIDLPPPYIPADNPYAGAGLPLDEIWSIGLRNPWRFSVDRLTGDLYIADVGQDTLDEIDFESSTSTGGKNYGWRCMEGTSCTGLSGCMCNSPLLTGPIAEYDHNSGDCSVIGGYVYRGCGLPNFQGTYFNADLCSNRIRSFRYDGATVTGAADRTAELTPPEGAIETIVSFGEDGAGELYIVSLGGSIYKIVPRDPGNSCGNGVIEPGEECDDNNTNSGDGCSSTCDAENAPANDDCIAAQAVTDGSYAFTTVESTFDGPDEASQCPTGTPPLSPDIWYCYTPHCTGIATVSNCGSSFDTMLAVYDGCTCPPGAPPIDCQDDNCGGSSSISFAVNACQTYMVRLGGYNGLTGIGTLTLTCQPNAITNDCDNSGVEDADEIACGVLLDNDFDGIPDVCEIAGDPLQGGRLYDRWWSVTGAAAPTTDHPLWAFRPDLTSNSATGSATWRCTECHGWDYKGVNGEYATGPYRTGIPGVFGTTRTIAELVSLLKEPPDNGGGIGVPNGHDYATVLDDDRINDLVAFLVGKVIDTDDYLNAGTGQFLGDPVVGQAHYNAMGTFSRCSDCHGPTGGSINFGTPEAPEYLGTIALNEPFHFLHRTRVGFPGIPMLGWIANGGDDQGAADMGRYAQIGLAVDCVVSSQCDDGIDCTFDSCNATGRCVYIENNAACTSDGLYCNGPEVCHAGVGCEGLGNPCWNPASCDEDNDHCGCTPPLLSVAGLRYLAITPQPASATTAMRLMVTADCPTAPTKYLGVPEPPLNIAPLLDDPQLAPRLTPTEWGPVVYVTGTYVVPEMQYYARAECGLPEMPVYTADVFDTNGLWGDIASTGAGAYGPPDGLVDAIDLVAMIDGFKHLPTAPPLFRIDVFGCTPNQQIDAIDIVGTLDAFKGISYLDTSCPGPCW